MKNITDIELAYIAGFIDGEGYIAIKSYGSGQHPLPCLQITQKDPANLYYVKDALGCGNVSFGRTTGISKYELKGFRSLFPILKKLRPFLRVKGPAADKILALPPREPGKKLGKPLISTAASRPAIL
jgi:hypothetical protein